MSSRSRRENQRYRLRAALILFGVAAVVVATGMGRIHVLGISSSWHHPEAILGRWLCGGYFFAVYFVVLTRMMLKKGSKWGRALLPALGLLAAVGLLCGMGVLASTWTESWLRTLSGHDTFLLSRFLNGASSMVPTMGLVMLLTPLMIPASQLNRVVRLFGEDFKSGTQLIDDYLIFSKPKVGEEEALADVLLVEDDLQAAALVLKFCRKLGLICHHVESLDDAIPIFETYKRSLRLLILDNFVRVGMDSTLDIKTGSQWAQRLNQQYPPTQRRFKIALMSGHTHLLKELSGEADLVLQKPWDPKELFKFLQAERIV